MRVVLEETVGEREGGGGGEGETQRHVMACVCGWCVVCGVGVSGYVGMEGGGWFG